LANISTFDKLIRLTKKELDRNEILIIQHHEIVNYFQRNVDFKLAMKPTYSVFLVILLSIHCQFACSKRWFRKDATTSIPSVSDTVAKSTENVALSPLSNLRVELSNKGLQFVTRTLQSIANRMINHMGFEDFHRKIHEEVVKDAQTVSAETPEISVNFP